MVDALDCDYVDAGIAESERGPRVVLRPHPRGATAKPMAYALDLEAARMLSLHLAEFVREAEAKK